VAGRAGAGAGAGIPSLTSTSAAGSAEVATGKGVVFRECIDRKTAKLATTKQGAAVEVKSTQRTETGTLQAETDKGWTMATTHKTDKGWTMATTHDLRPLLQPAGGDDDVDEVEARDLV
jgi:hypothetical protein